jgi:uncharacterized protein YybS (DUF2232 family)
VVSLRLLGGESAKLVADNCILLLSITYAVGGLALMEFYMKRLGLSLLFRILFYIFLTLTWLIGFLVSAVLGFIDSFADWRRFAPAGEGGN